MILTTATLALFHALLVDEVQPTISSKKPLNVSISEQHLLATVMQGYICDPKIVVDDELIETINKVVGLSGEQMNQAFHKSWQVIVDTPLEKLIAQQITHYFTTYGLESLGLFDKDVVYVPNEVLNVPANQMPNLETSAEFLKNDLPLTVIHAIDREDLLAKVIDLASGIALADSTLTHLTTIITTLLPKTDTVNSDSHEAKAIESLLNRLKNRELSTRLNDYYQLVPSAPLDYLRYVIYRLTCESLLIKNDKLIAKIKEADADLLDALIEQAPDTLASIFLRYKPLFLAMKSVSKNKHFFNRLRKDADRLHKPLAEDYLNNITRYIQQGRLDFDTFSTKLNKATIYRKIRLANALSYRLNHNRSIVYRVRNGRGWATSFDWDTSFDVITKKAFEATVASIVKDISPKVTGKTFYIPEHVHYALPATEKQFTGEFPTGSWVAVPKDLILGIHWTNVDEQRVDLDLAMMSIKGEKIGWDARYYDDDKDIIFSGDMTDAPLPQGAAELFYIKHKVDNTQALTVNFYNYIPDIKVDCTMFVASKSVAESEIIKNYMVDPNHIVMKTILNISSPQNILCLITPVASENRIYFANINVGTSITNIYNDYTKHAQNYLMQTATQTLQLDDILTKAGAIIVHNLPDDSESNNFEDSELDKYEKLDKNKAVLAKPSLLKHLLSRLASQPLSETLTTNNDVVNQNSSATKEAGEPSASNADSTPIINLAPENINKHTFISLLNTNDD